MKGCVEYDAKNPYESIGEIIGAWCQETGAGAGGCVPGDGARRERVREQRKMNRNEYFEPCIDTCEECPLVEYCPKRGCLESAEAVAIVEKWAQEHPEERSEK